MVQVEIHVFVLTYEIEGKTHWKATCSELFRQQL